ncbi:MAG: tRNA (adenosine(37)-N6)-threonylcarbamoyltransferase complex dimerization subunit type 1 TsaB, partial [Chitinophagales bacterium]
MASTLLLHIETSSPVCSVALSRSGTLIALKELAGNANHAAMLTMIIDQLMNESKIEMKALDGIALSAGPGSYTGLRIGAATAKGLCFALDKPLIAVDSLQSLAVGMSSIQK